MFMGTRFVTIGDIHGMAESLTEALAVARRRWGRFDFVLAVGDVEPNRNETDWSSPGGRTLPQ